jgi:hypothetical protein
VRSSRLCAPGLLRRFWRMTSGPRCFQRVHKWSSLRLTGMLQWIPWHVPVTRTSIEPQVSLSRSIRVRRVSCPARWLDRCSGYFLTPSSYSLACHLRRENIHGQNADTRTVRSFAAL